MGVPTTTSSCPVCRCSRVWKAASSVMNRVIAVWRLSASSLSVSDLCSTRRWRAPEASGLPARGRSVGSGEDGQGAGQLAPPVGELGGEDVALEPVALPEGEVGVLDGAARGAGTAGRRRRRRRGPRVRGGGRPWTSRRTRCDAGSAGGGARPSPSRSRVARSERALGEVEGPLRLDGGEASGLGARAGGRGAPGGPLSGEAGGRGGDDLHDVAVGRGEGGAEDFVAAADLVEALLEGGRVERAGEPEGDGEVVGRAAGLELVEEPEPLLGERCGRRVVGRAGASPLDPRPR